MANISFGSAFQALSDGIRTDGLLITISELIANEVAVPSSVSHYNVPFISYTISAKIRYVMSCALHRHLNSVRLVQIMCYRRHMSSPVHTTHATMYS